MNAINLEAVSLGLAEIRESEKRAAVFFTGIVVGGILIWLLARDSIERERRRAAQAERDLELTEDELDELQDEIHGLEKARAAAGGSTT